LLSAHGATVAYGGRIFNIHPELRHQISGHYLGETLDAGLKKMEDLLMNKTDVPELGLRSTEYTDILKAFLLKRPLIENTVNEQLEPFGINPDYFVTANQNLGNNLIAAMQLGNLNLINSELAWLEAIIRVNHLPPQVISSYLKIYASAVDLQMGEQGSIISTWLNENAG
jgi:hypothetical protein